MWIYGEGNNILETIGSSSLQYTQMNFKTVSVSYFNSHHADEQSSVLSWLERVEECVWS